MFKTRTFWAILLAIATSVVIFEVRINLSGSPLWTRAASIISVPGERLVTALDPQSSPLAAWPRLLGGISLACNFFVYAIFWYVCVWTIGYLRARRHPYDRQPTMLYH